MTARIPALVWIFLPLAAGALYAGLHPLFAPVPNATNMPPDDAVLVFRYRDFVALDAGHVFEPPPVPWSEVIAAESNVPGLPGVDRGRPVYVIQMPPNLRHDSAMVVFPVADADRFERAFMDPEMIERGRTRRPKHLHVAGPWAAVGPDRDTVRRIGTGTLVCEERGEAWSVAADVEGLATLALVEAAQPVWREILAALGVDVGATEVEVDLESGTQHATFPESQRLGRIVASWETARLWAFSDAERVEVELVPRAESAVARRMRALTDAPPPAALPPGPPARDAGVWLWVPGGGERALLLETLAGAGADVPAAWREAETLSGGALVYGAGAAGIAYAVTWVAVTPAETPLDLAPLLGTDPAPGASLPLAADAAPLTVVDTGHERTAPAGRVVRRRLDHRNGGDGLDAVAVGAAAERALGRLESDLALDAAFAPPEPPRAGLRLVAAFGMDRSRADMVLGDALGAGGLFAVLAGGPVDGALWTDGEQLLLTARVVGRR